MLTLADAPCQQSGIITNNQEVKRGTASGREFFSSSPSKTNSGRNRCIQKKSENFVAVVGGGGIREAWWCTSKIVVKRRSLPDPHLEYLIRLLVRKLRSLDSVMSSGRVGGNGLLIL